MALRLEQQSGIINQVNYQCLKGVILGFVFCVASLEFFVFFVCAWPVAVFQVIKSHLADTKIILLKKYCVTKIW